MGRRVSLIERSLKRPHIIISLLSLFLFAGFVGYSKIDRNLFPNSNYPEVAVVIVEPSASARGYSHKYSSTNRGRSYIRLMRSRRAYSNTIDEVTVVRAEFEV